MANAESHQQQRLRAVKRAFDDLKQNIAALETVKDGSLDDGALVMRSNGKFLATVDVTPGSNTFIVTYPRSKRYPDPTGYNEYYNRVADVVDALSATLHHS